MTSSTKRLKQDGRVFNGLVLRFSWTDAPCRHHLASICKRKLSNSSQRPAAADLRCGQYLPFSAFSC